MAPSEIDNAFWRFSLRVYGSPGVAAECLELQDTLGLDVNVVLFAVWLGVERGRTLDRSDIDGIERMVAGWSSDVVQPLRAVRRTLKSMPEMNDPQVQSLRRRIAETELFSEQIEQAMLYHSADRIGRPADPGEAAARGNVEALLGRHGGKPGVFPHRLFAAANAEE